MGSTVLIIEDEPLLARNLRLYLEREGFSVDTAGTLSHGEALIRDMQPDLILVDQNLPDGKGVDLIERLRAGDRTTKVVMLTAHGGVRLAVEAMKVGADDYLNKPVSLEEVALLARKLLSQTRLEGSLAYYRNREERSSGIDRIVGNSPAVAALKARIQQMLSMEARHSGGPLPAVLITGETGTGKELVARAIHFSGPRRSAPFVEINCATLPRDLVESELFGHEKGAFTDARERRQGLVQAADGGTLFLDEVGDMPLPVQAKLLKVLEDQTVRPVGSAKEREVSVRFIAATNADLEEKVAAGEFRADLFFRLATIRITSPPLRERGDDVLILARHFLAEIGRRYGREGVDFDSEASLALIQHRWPGNIRELRNVVEQAVLLTVGEGIGASDLTLREPPTLARESERIAAGGNMLAGAERDLILQALSRAHGNVTTASRELGISRDTLRYRMEKHGLSRDDFLR